MKKLHTLFAGLVIAATVMLTFGQTLAVASPVNGPKYDVHSVRAYSSDIYSVTFRGGERGTILVSGDGDTDLDLYVYDQNGRLLGSDTDYSDDCVVVIYPRWTQTVRIVVKNRGSVYNRYEIAAI
ncbi:MAG: hypothetical protein KDA84_07670 [Planctomycetaceae bacterium]|nr:hypothetical protein [Planctomycetaceae bacterium]